MKKKIILLAIMVFMLAIPVFAKNNDGMYADDSINLKERIETTSFVAGNNVEMASEVDGLNFVAGNNLNLSSTQDHLFAAGNSIRLENVNTKDAFVAGSTITVIDSTIRNLFAAAQTIRIDSNISRNAYVAGDKVTINSTIAGDVKIAADDIRIGKEAVIKGTLSYPEDAKISISESAVVAQTKTYTSEKVNIPAASIVVNIITGFLSLLIVGLILRFINPQFFTNMEKEEKSANYLLKTSLKGFGFLVLLPFAAILIMLTIIGIPLSIISLLVYSILIYLSAISTSYYLGKWIINDNIKNDYLLLTVSLLGLTIIKMIPIIGGLVKFISLIFGLGIFISFFKKSYVETKE